jgi:hypothetical protein
MSFYFIYDIYPSFYLKLIYLRRVAFIHFYPIFPSDFFFVIYLSFIFHTFCLSVCLFQYLSVNTL